MARRPSRAPGSPLRSQQPLETLGRRGTARALDAQARSSVTRRLGPTRRQDRAGVAPVRCRIRTRGPRPGQRGLRATRGRRRLVATRGGSQSLCREPQGRDGVRSGRIAARTPSSQPQAEGAHAGEDSRCEIVSVGAPRCGHRAGPCRPLQVGELYGLGGYRSLRLPARFHPWALTHSDVTFNLTMPS